MLFSSPLSPLLAGLRRALPADVSRRPTPADWPFAPLTDSQRRAHAELQNAVYDGALRGLPTVFGELT